MNFSVILLTAGIITALLTETFAQGSCRLLTTPRNGVISGCTRGSRKGSICTTSCKEGYTQNSSSRQCRCFNDLCIWTGRNAICNKKICTRPDFDDAKLTIVDEWPRGFAGLVQFRNVPTKIIDGWSIVLVFDRGLGPNAQLSSWGMEPTTVSVTRHAFTINNLPHNNNLTAQGSQFSALFVVDQVEGGNPERGYVGMYDHRIGDATCYVPPDPMPLLKEFPPFTTPPPTTTTTTTPEPTTTTQPAIVRRVTVPEVPTTTDPVTTSIQQSENGPAKILINFQFKAPTESTTTVSTITTDEVTTTNSTTVASTLNPVTVLTTEPASVETSSVSLDDAQVSNKTQLMEIDGRRCKMQTHEKKYRTQQGWVDEGKSLFSGNAVVEITEVVEDWLVVVVFEKQVDEVQVWNTIVDGYEEGGFMWKFGPHTWNDELHPGMLDVNFIAKLHTISEVNPEAYVYLCASQFEKGDPIHWFNGLVPSLMTNSTSSLSANEQSDDDVEETNEEEEEEDNLVKTPTTRAPIGTTSRPTNLARCKGSAPSGRKPIKPGQVKLKWKRGKVLDKTPYDYNEVLYKSILFYEAQRAGALPPNYNRIPWRGDSCLKDGCIIGTDLSGGWFDAGDYIKFTFPMAFSVTTLAWGGIMFRDAYTESGNLNRFLGGVKWPVNYLMNAHVSKYELVGQVGNGRAEHRSWSRPEKLSPNRPVYTINRQSPGSELAGETAAALASAYILLKKTHRPVANEALRHAKELYEFADKYRGDYHKSIPQVAEFYSSFSGYNDELIWAAAWLYKATKNATYLSDAEALYLLSGGQHIVAGDFSWDNKMVGCQALLANLTGKDIYRFGVERYMNRVMTQMPKTPKGMLWSSEWSPNRYAANAALIGLAASQLEPPLPGRDVYISWSRKQIHLLLGDDGRSYVVGFGKNPPKRPHHRSSSCRPAPASCSWVDFHTSKPNPFTLYGALIGGPDIKGRFRDNRQNIQQNEVAIDYNAGFQSAVAGLKHLVLKKRKSKPTPAQQRRRRPTNPPKRKPTAKPKRPTPTKPQTS